jgi:hypothetical protein
MGTLRRSLTAALVIGLAGCTRKAPDLTPEGTVRELLDRIDRSEADPTEARGIYELLATETKANLIERARRASARSGREVPPEDMLAPGRYFRRFEPRGRMYTRFDDSGVLVDHAVVDVVGINPQTDHAEVPCRLEDGRWRIVIPLPELGPMERRIDEAGR